MERRNFILFFSFLMCLCALTSYGNEKARLIVTTDLGGSDPDDIQSMIHLLVCSDRIDIEGLISSEAWIDDPDKTEKLRNTVESFIEVLPILCIHSSDYPSADYLRSIIAQGQDKPHMNGVGEGKDSPGSELIADAIRKEDDRPLWIAAWGGMNTVAQALYKLKNQMDDKTFADCLSKVRIFDVLGQDDAGAYIAKNYPAILYIRDKDVYGWAPSDQWTQDNIQSRLPLGAYYPNRIWATEGDSPSFLYVYSNGLNDPENPDYGGWGGRFSKDKIKNIRGMDFIEKSGKSEKVFDDYYMIGSAPEGNNSIKRWEDAIHNDFAARMIWTQEKSYEKANHHPRVVVNGNNDKKPIYLSGQSKGKVFLSAIESSDPDGDKLQYKWYVYEEPSDYSGSFTIDSENESECTLILPEKIGESGIHIILEVTDNGVPSLTSYKRIIIKH